MRAEHDLCPALAGCNWYISRGLLAYRIQANGSALRGPLVGKGEPAHLVAKTADLAKVVAAGPEPTEGMRAAVCASYTRPAPLRRSRSSAACRRRDKRHRPSPSRRETPTLARRAQVKTNAAGGSQDTVVGDSRAGRGRLCHRRRQSYRLAQPGRYRVLP